MHVTIEINGRQALPVRAIPLLTDWRGFPPDQLAHILAGDSDHWPSFDGLTAYRLHPDGSTEAIPQRWWASWVVGKLEATSNTIKAKQTSRATGRLQWRGDSLAQLPAAVFVWRDDFEAAHAHEYGPVGMRARSNPEGFDPSAHALDFNPQPDPDIAPPRLLLEGFAQLVAQSTSRNFEELCFVRALNSADKNDAHWLGLENLSSQEAAALLCGHDPLNKHGCDAQCVALLERRLTDYNESHPARRSWREWHRVAKAIGAEYEKGFDDYFSESAQASKISNAGVPAQPQAATPELVAPDSTDDMEAWKVKARERANEIIERQRARDLYPSQEAIADEIAKEFRQACIVGAGGKPLTGAYIKRHALKGISSAQNRQLSTSIRRGK